MPDAPHGPYHRRHVRFLELWEDSGWRVKVYAITQSASPVPPALLDTGKRIARTRLATAEQDDPRHHGLAVLTVHEGQNGDYVLVDWWSDNDILRHHNYGGPKGGDMTHQWPGPAACVWEMAVTGFERAAWIEHVLSPPDGPDLPAYFAARLHGAV